MKYHIKYLIYTAVFVFVMQACVDKEYNWDNIDKNGVISIPPVPLGSIDTIYIHGLPQGETPWGIPIPDFSITRSDTIKGLFEGNAVKNFFFEGANTVEISAKIDIDLEIKGVNIDIYFDIINYDNTRNINVKIPKQTLTTINDQVLSIKVDSEYMRYMEGAKDLLLTIVLSSEDGTVWLGENDYIYIRDTIIKTGGFHYEL